ncbi:MAG: DUF3782 domain-containing protein [Caldimicrobium sp.]|nr:DUF3782 domain-containing protein [Caldimicrobium sp.]MDW8183221.1 DUF3782 domain-containing protein [Caldimicrobium sp.]
MRQRKKTLTKHQLRQIILEKLPALLEKEPPLRDFIAGFFKTHFSEKEQTERDIKFLMEEIVRLREESEKRWTEALQRLDEQSKILDEHSKILREHSKILREHSERLEQLSKELISLRKRQDVQIVALGARWDIKSENTFRNALKGLLEETFPIRVDRYETTDLDGEVFEGHPGKIVELDLIIRDGELIVAELKSSISPADVWIFEKKVKLFEKREGKKVHKKVIISPMIDPKALDFCKELNIVAYTDVPYPEEGL